jgi:hypothetical protein
MKYILLLLLFQPLLVIAQQKDLNDTIEFRYGLPVSGDDTTDEVRSDQDPANQWVAVSESEIPRKLRRVLDRNEAYEGWEKGTIYFDKSINQYLLRMRVDDAIRTFGFMSDGSAVSFTEERILPSDSID